MVQILLFLNLILQPRIAAGNASEEENAQSSVTPNGQDLAAQTVLD